MGWTTTTGRGWPTSTQVEKEVFLAAGLMFRNQIPVFSVCLQQVSAEGAGGDAPAAGAAAQRAAAAGAAAAPRPPAPRAARRRVRAAAARRHRVRLAPLPPIRLHGALRVQEVQSRSVDGFQDHFMT